MNGKQVIRSAYDMRLSGAMAELEEAGVVRLHYHPTVMGVYTKMKIYYWSGADEAWQEVGGEPGEVDNAFSASVSRLGIYALMGEQVDESNRTYLPACHFEVGQTQQPANNPDTWTRHF